MKKLVFLFSLLPTVLFSQVYVDKYNINADENINFCEVTVNVHSFNRITYCFDYGQRLERRGLSGTVSHRVFGGDKKEVKFNGLIDIMNFMTNNGWEVFDGPYRANDFEKNRCVFIKARE